VVELPFTACADESQVCRPARDRPLTAAISRRPCAKEQQQNHNDERGGECSKNFGREAHLNMPNFVFWRSFAP
jgi:hypothetical protein